MAKPANTRKRAAPEPPNGKPSKRAKVAVKPPSKPAARKLAAQQTVVACRSPPSRKLDIYVFGEGSAGELGLGSKARDVKRPRLNPNLAGVVAVAAGGMHAVALTAKNKLLTWGINDEHTLARDTTWDGGLRDLKDEDQDSDSDADDEDLNPLESTPTPVSAHLFPPGTEFVQVAAGDSTTFALTSEGLVYGWGTFRDMNGRFGFTIDPATGAVIKAQTTPLLIPQLKHITSLSIGADYALALDSNGHVYAWGSGQQNQLGRRIIERRRLQTLLPQRAKLPKTRRIVSIHAGIDHAFAIDSSGDTWAWGSNNFAQTGITTGAGEGNTTIVVPQKVSTLRGRNMLTIQGGRHHSIGVTQDGECLVWGRMDGAQMGIAPDALPLSDPSKVLIDERSKPRVLLQPTAVPIKECVQATAGPDHCIAITAEGKAYSWGFNANYQCGQGDTTDDVLVATLIDNTAVRDRTICWARAGGQYSLLAAVREDVSESANGPVRDR